MNEKISVLGEPISSDDLMEIVKAHQEGSTLEELAVENLSNTVNIHEVLKWVTERHGKIFSIKFIKRTDGTERVMVCRTGVKSRLVPTKNHTPLDHKSYDLISVFDMQKDNYRSIPIEGIIEVKMHGKWLPVTHEPRWIICGNLLFPRTVLVHDPITRRRGVINNPSLELFKLTNSPLPQAEYSNVVE